MLQFFFYSCSLFLSVLTCQHQPRSQPLPPWNTHFPWLLLVFLWFTSHLFLVSFVNIASFIWPSNVGILQSWCLLLLLFLLCIHVFSDFTHRHDFKYDWHADIFHISISSKSFFFKIQAHKSSCLLDILTWMFPRHLKPNRSAESSWLPLPALASSVLSISANGTTLHQWLIQKLRSHPSCLCFPHVSHPIHHQLLPILPYIISWIDWLLSVSIATPWAWQYL